MNKKLKGIIILLFGAFLVLLIINKNKKISYGEFNIFNTLISFFSSFFYLFFGRMITFVSISCIIFGLFTIGTKNIKLKFHKSKVISFFGLFISLSVKYISEGLVSPEIKSTNIVSSIFNVGANGISGGLLGALFSLPFFGFIESDLFYIFLIISIVFFVLIMFKDLIYILFETIISNINFYTSENYKKKKITLKAKKISEKEKYKTLRVKEREEKRKKKYEDKTEKINFEISKKQKESIFKKPEIYTSQELLEKEKEWLDFFENRKSTEKIKTDFFFNNLKQEKKEIVEEETHIEEKKKDALDNFIENIPKNTKIIVEDIKLNDLPLVTPEVINKNIETKIQQNETIKNVEEMKITSEHNGVQDTESRVIEIEDIFTKKMVDTSKKEEIDRSIKENIKHLELALKEFGIDAKVVRYERGPTITRYELTIPRGVRVNKVTSLADDIAMNLAAESIRIEAPIPGKSTIGIETPNKIKEPVHFSNMIRNPELDKGALNIILGKNIVGQDRIVDIAKMPHLLIAGQTGSGKSVAINTLISTLITKKSDKDVKFIMIDPKMVELMPFNDIAHLLLPVIIDPKMAAIALKWAVNEMENRYKILMEHSVRNIVGYNSLPKVEKMPYIVIIIDELADLMMVASKSVEESIARIAQKARAIGIHLVVATQRPSTDVITGMIKANLPSRISFALRSQIDSRTILDSVGAEKLLGQGDMLILENGSSKLERIQGAYISDDEVTKLISALKAIKKPNYRTEILEDFFEDSENLDPLFNDAVEIAKGEEKLSISLVQRKLKVGFNRASNIFEQLKEKGIIDENNIPNNFSKKLDEKNNVEGIG